jgi:hypothetical protein
MTSYNFQGLLVDVKATNWHMSAKPDTTLNNNYDTVATTIPVGGIVMPGTVTGTVDNATTGIATYLGVANETRNAGDSRPVTYTWAGVVRVITDNSAIIVGSRLMCGAEGKVKLVTAAGAAVAESAIQFGRALEANGGVDETIIMAYINMA